MLFAEARFVPGLVGETGNVEIGPGEMLRTAQRMHAGIGKPRALLPLLGLVDGEDVGDLGAHQPECGSDTGLTGANDEHVERRPGIGARRRRQPSSVRVRRLGKIGSDLSLEGDQSTAHAASQPPSTTMTVPVMNDDASLARCSAVSATSSALPNRFMAWRWRDASRTGSGSACRAKLRRSIGVSMAPGAMALTRMPSAAKSTAIVR